MHHPKILDAVEDVIGPDILCWTTNFFIKEANSPGFVSWHQDSTYWGLEPDDVVTAWVAFTDATPENGCMQFMPGTQTQVDQLPHVDTFHKDNLLSRGQEIAVEVDESKRSTASSRPARCRCTTSSWCTAPSRTAPTTAASASRSATSRPMCARPRCATRPCSCAASTSYRNFDHEPRPQADLDEAALAAHADAVARQVEGALLRAPTSRSSGVKTRVALPRNGHSRDGMAEERKSLTVPDLEAQQEGAARKS